MAIRYPQEAVLRDGRRLLVRPFTENDVEALYQFFLRLPSEVRRFAWDRIDSRALVESWGRELDYSKVLPLLALEVAGAAELLRPGDPFSYEADVVTTDLRTQTLEISGNVRVTQGTNSIQSGAARAVGPSENSRWSFHDGVRIVTREAELSSDSASASVVSGQLSQAHAEGSPAQFQQRGGSSNREIRGRAGVIDYDFDAGIVKLTDQVWFSNGKDEFRGDVVIYNVRDERVQINPGGSSNRVRGIIRPSNSANKPKTNSGAANGSAAIVEPTFNDDPVAERKEQRLATDGGGA